ncbi:endoribonuclease LACTB2 [Neodiprion lecontei]|uniref:Endoribonuclease LACTB2 n=1 Tax=Neodiprion lecontei TaxID=441921 RepID=A0A6J0BWK9_NEOLC|nr:endoribonuclease LACTB2 [Neodiprion lecontei]
MTSLTAIPTVSRISSRVIRILGCNPGPMTLQGTNTYLVGTGPRRILIDAGEKTTSTEYTKHLTEVLRSENATLEHLLLTHWHHDHIGGVSAVKALVESTVTEPNKSKNWEISKSDRLRVSKLPRAPDDFQNISDDERSLKWEAMENGQSFRTEGATLTVKWTPGHTTDHACLKLEEENAIFSGDCILGEGTAVFEDLYDYMASLSEILDISPKLIYPGHGPVIEDPVPRIKFYIAHRHQREKQILDVLYKHATETPMSEIDIVRRVYKDTPENLWIAAAENVNHHLKKLLKERKVRGDTGAWLKCV